MSKKLGLFVASASMLSLAACTALLGSYEVGATAAGPDGSGPGTDAADDGMTNGETGGDAATEAGVDAAPPPLLKCSLNGTNANQLDTGSITQDLAAYSISATQTRVIAGKYRQGVTIYTYDRNGGGGSTTVTPLTGVGRILQIRRLPNGIGILSVDQPPPGVSGTSIGVWTVDDVTGQGVRTAFHVVNETNQMSGAFAPIGTDFLFAYGDATSMIQAGRFVAGGGAPALVTIASGLSPEASSVSAVEVANNRAYIFNNANPGNGASSGYYVADPSLMTAAGALTSLAGTPGKSAFNLLGDTSLGNFQEAVVELDLVNGMPPAVLHAGPVPSAKATTFNVLDLPTVTTFTSILDAPFGDHTSARFEGDNFFALGPNPNKDPGLNFVWFDTKQKVLRAINGSANNLLPMRTTTSIAAVLTQSTAIFASFDVVWTENASNNGNTPTPATLYSSQMNCLK